MPKLKLTAATVRDLPTPPSGQVLYTDETLQGFGLRATPGGKTYYAESRVAGRTRRVTIGKADVFTLDEARKQARVALGSMATGIDPNKAKADARAKSITQDEAVRDFLAGRDLKEGTRADYKMILETYFAGWRKKQLKDITPNDCVARFDKITRENGPTTANLAFRVYRSMYGYARAATAGPDGRYTLPENPVKRLSDLRRWHKTKRRQTYLPDDLFPAFKAHLDRLHGDLNPNAHAFADYLELLLRAGLRKSEGLGLLWSDVNMTARTFTLRDTKNRTDHTLPVSDQLLALFQRRVESKTDERVFSGRDGACTAFQHWLEKAREPIGYPLQFHDLRRNFSILGSNLNVEHYRLKKLLNHTTNTDVTAGYVIITVDRLREPMQQISNEIDRLMGIIPKRTKNPEQEQQSFGGCVPLANLSALD
ncbi:tyrosine-type recombinase/integrase [Paracoccus sp. DMF]|uniref:tyrosine-type recombinase/integrase n=1 Tax=Paracoccus sp. DMF TaxID=400837 RepID=UPI001100B80A|nr:integrase family protein [Paracoccus sp. DMF]MCV2446556.1 integrase family protein [Paracoccus sp. DMF]